MNSAGFTTGKRVLDQFGPGEVHIEMVWNDGSRVGCLVSEASTNKAPVFLRGAQYAMLTEELAEDGRSWIKSDADPTGRLFRRFMTGSSGDSALSGKPQYEVWYRQDHGAFDLGLAVYQYESDGERFAFDLIAVEGRSDAVLVDAAPTGSGLQAGAVVPFEDVQDAILRQRDEGAVSVALHGSVAAIRQMEAKMAHQPTAMPAPVPVC